MRLLRSCLKPFGFFSFFSLFFFIPQGVWGYSNWGIQNDLFSLYDLFFDVLSFSAALVALGLSLSLILKLTGSLKKAWIFLIIATLIFVILQVISVLSIFSLFDISGLFSVFKFLFAICLLAFTIILSGLVRKLLLAKSGSAKFTPKPFS